MRLILLGTSGYHPSDQRHTACLMLPELGIMFDAGTALFRAVDYLVTEQLDIFLTHAHLDHIVGLTYLLDVLATCPLDRITVHGTPDILRAVEHHLFAPALFPVSPPFDLKPLPAQVLLAEGGQLTHFRLAHPGGSTGFRLDFPGRSLAYVTDTTAADHVAYRAAIEGVDLLVHECHFAADEPELARLTGHSCLKDVARLAAEAGVGQLVLVHINPRDGRPSDSDLAVARAIFPRTVVGEDRDEFHF
ncbi:MAG: MBL fold metallo-hydrolase [Pirellulales bacterium]